MTLSCIRNKCQDPCPGTCGTDAICTTQAHVPTCSCPPGLTGNPFQQCIYYQDRVSVVEHKDPCYPSPCGQSTICRSSSDKAICECIHGYYGNPYSTGCHPECTISADCPWNRACSNLKCIDPCPGVCGYGAICNVVNHSPICSCPTPTEGDPFVQCHEMIKVPHDPCHPSPCANNGICRVINGVASCQYPECVINDDCSYNRACLNQKCRDPCINACGINAICNPINHKATCICPSGFLGSPFVQCIERDESIIPKSECTQDADCNNDKACINERCINPCLERNICAENAECHVQLHRPLCVCREGLTGNAQVGCYESK